MNINYIDRKEAENIVPIKIPNKEEYYLALNNIEYSWSGRLDVMFSDAFIREAIQLVINAIVLFEKGYFDCAFYSLRQSLEISTTVVYFVDDSEDNRNKELKKWKNQDNFPMHSKMIDQLKKREGVFANIRDKMNLYFSEIEEVRRTLNKYVHKQGYDKFYVLKDHPLNSKREEEKAKMIADFECFIIKCIGTIAVLRLTIDPLPILLMEESVYNRTGDLITEAYNEEFVGKYIGENHIEAYRKTDLYKGWYESIIDGEEMLPSVVGLVKHQYIDRSNIEEILSQKHLLSQDDLIVVALVSYSDKIANIYFNRGLRFYHTNVKSRRTKTGFSSSDFDVFADEAKSFNIKYDESFLSHLIIQKDDCFIEHNEVFNITDVAYFAELVSKSNGS